ncbi:MAG TPA: N-acetylmuramoyl-L-alanine amidase [Candidatus Eisenbacteria bacterium]
MSPARRLAPAAARGVLAGRVFAAALAAAAIAAVLPAAAQRGGAPVKVRYAGQRPDEKLVTVPIGPTDYVSTNDLARIFGATQFWRPELRKLTLRIGDHTVRFTVDSPVALVDEKPANLVEPPRLIRGVVYVPRSVLDHLGEWNLLTDALWDPQTSTIHFRGIVHNVRQVQLWPRDRVTEVTATLLGSVPPRLLYATPTELRVLFEGGTLDTARVFTGGLVSYGTVDEVPEGVELRLGLTGEARGYQISSSPSRLKVAVTRDEDLIDAGLFTKLEPVAIGDRGGRIRTVVIDPGHGGGDLGASLPGGVAEKDYTLEAARALRQAIAQRLDARVLLTREGDVDVPLARRAEIANEAGAHLFVSVHADAEGRLRSGGFRVYALSPVAAGADRAQLPVPLGDGEGPFLRPWRSAQAPEAGASMAIGQAVTDALARAFPGAPVSFRAAPVNALEPVLCPAILIEIAPAPRSGPEAQSLRSYSLSDVAQTVAEAIREVARGERG